MENEMDDEKLNRMQRTAYQCMVNGENIFLTGPGGVGKSYVLKKFISDSINTRKVAVTSTTGVSAVNIGGVTLHSYLGIRPGVEAQQLLKFVLRSQRLEQNWMVDTLIIDEVSMLSAELFELIDIVAKTIRMGYTMIPIRPYPSSVPPFGGMQIILSGDFAQLPVIGSKVFCFESPIWNKTLNRTIHLTQIVRQTDEKFQNLLNEIRFGIVTPETKKLLNERIGKNVEYEGIVPTKLYTTNSDVDNINESELDKLAEDNREFHRFVMKTEIIDKKEFNQKKLDKFMRTSLVPHSIDLCVGAQVMMLKNSYLEFGIINGSRGVVVGFDAETIAPIVKFHNGVELVIEKRKENVTRNDDVLFTYNQIPLKLAWAITVHKSQSCTLDCAEINLSNVFAHGMAYVALSRVRSLEGISLRKNPDYSAFTCDPKVKEYYENLETEDLYDAEKPAKIIMKKKSKKEN